MPKRYTEEEINTYLALAQEVGHGKAIRELGYPSYPMAIRWANARGVEVNINKIMQDIKKVHAFYQEEDLIVLIEETLERARGMVMESSLDADSLKKVSESIQKMVNTWQLLKGRPNNITETRSEELFNDAEILKLIEQENERATNYEFKKEE